MTSLLEAELIQENNHGSSLILLDEAKGEDQMFCSKVPKAEWFLDIMKRLKAKEHYWNECYKPFNWMLIKLRTKWMCLQCELMQVLISKKYLKDPQSPQFWNNPKYENILLDQYGFKEVDNDVLKANRISKNGLYILYFFIIQTRRFKEHPYILRYFEPTESTLMRANQRVS